MSKASNAEQLVDATIGVAAHLESELEEALAEHRLTRASFLVLTELERADGHTLNQREVVARVRRTSGTMSVRLGRLEHAGIITRERDPENGRNVTVTLTERGLRLVQAALPAYRERSERLVSALAADAQSALSEHVPAWLAFFEPDGRLTPRLGVAVAPSAVAGQDAPRGRPRRGARGPDHAREARQSGRPGRSLPRRPRGGGRRRAGAQHRRSRPCRARRRERAERPRAARRRAARALGPLRRGRRPSEREPGDSVRPGRRRSTPTRAPSSRSPRASPRALPTSGSCAERGGAMPRAAGARS